MIPNFDKQTIMAQKQREIRPHVGKGNIWSKHPLVAPDIGLPSGLEKINSRTITTSKQPLCTEKALPSVFWKEVLSRVSPAQLSCRLESCGVSRSSPTTPCPPVAQSVDGTKDTHCL